MNELLYTKSELNCAMIAGALIILILQIVLIVTVRTLLKWMNKKQDD